MTDYTVYDLLSKQDYTTFQVHAALYRLVRNDAEASRALWLADGNLILETLPMRMVFAVGYLAGRAGLPDEDQVQNDLPPAATAPCPDCGAVGEYAVTVWSDIHCKIRCEQCGKIREFTRDPARTTGTPEEGEAEQEGRNPHHALAQRYQHDPFCDMEPEDLERTVHGTAAEAYQYDPGELRLLQRLNLTPDDFYRYRRVGCDRTSKLWVSTRGGGRNRDCYCHELDRGEDPRRIVKDSEGDLHFATCAVVMHEALRRHPAYLDDIDDIGDGTYATWYFNLPPDAA